MIAGNARNYPPNTGGETVTSRAGYALFVRQVRAMRLVAAVRDEWTVFDALDGRI